MTANSNFYVTGGTLSGDAVSYVQREADTLLYTSLCQNEYCYILTSRQMGKSSLMVRTAARLKECGIQTAVVDLTSLGQNLTVEQWYKGILNRIGQWLDIEEELDDYWYAQASLPPLERWLTAIQKVILTLVPDEIVLFIDEIDMVRSLPFPTDEFFAGIRACYNRREQESGFGRLTFCLLGVASPSDLIQDSHMTPFNIGRRIELNDFTEDEAAMLAVGISVTGRDATPLMRRILYWTGGQPYLTQRLCAVVAAEEAVMMSGDVDQWCRRLFLAQDVRQNETNLAFVRNRILKSGQDIASLLDLYRRILAGRGHVEYDPIDPLCEVLRLSGIVRVADRLMHVRNRIYAQVFDSGWVRHNMPDAEILRQAQAYRRGLLRALAIASVAVASMGTLLYLTIRSDKHARDALALVRKERDIANGELYTTNMHLAEEAYREGDIGLAEQLMEACRLTPSIAHYRGFEWRLLWGLLHQDRHTLVDSSVDSSKRVLCTAFSPDGKLLVMVDSDGTIRQWSTETGTKSKSFVFHYKGVSAAAVTGDAGIVAIATDEHMLRLHDASTGRVLHNLPAFTSSACCLSFSQDGRLMAVGSFDGSITLWDTGGGTLLRTFPKCRSWIDALAFSVDGRTLVASNDEGVTSLLDVTTGRILTQLQGNPGKILCAAFSPDGRSLATGGFDGYLMFWDIKRGTALRRISAHQNRVLALAYSRDGRKLATASWDTTIKLWNVASGHEFRTFKGHKNRVQCVAFSPDGRTVASGSDDTKVKIWDITLQQSRHLDNNRSLTRCISFAADGRTVATSNLDNQIVLWDILTGRQLSRFESQSSVLDLSQDAGILAVADLKGAVSLYNLRDRTVTHLNPTREAIWALAISPNEQEFAVGGKGSTVTCMDIKTGRTIRTIPTNLAPISILTFAAQGHFLALADTNGAITVIDLMKAKILFTSKRPNTYCCGFCFSPKGDKLAAGFADGTVELWDTGRGASLWAVQGHVRSVYALAFSPDGINLATGGDDRVVRIWNIELHHVVWTLSGHNDIVYGLNFTPDGRALITIDDGRTVTIWHAQAADTIPAPAPS